MTDQLPNRQPTNPSTRRGQARRGRILEQGFTRYEVECHPEDRAAIKALADAMKARRLEGKGPLPLAEWLARMAAS